MSKYDNERAKFEKTNNNVKKDPDQKTFRALLLMNILQISTIKWRKFGTNVSGRKKLKTS